MAKYGISDFFKNVKDNGLFQALSEDLKQTNMAVKIAMFAPIAAMSLGSAASAYADETKHKDSNGNTYEPGQELMKMDYNAPGNMLQVIANSAPQIPQKNGFLGMAHYANIDLDYHGFYKIVEYYEV